MRGDEFFVAEGRSYGVDLLARWQTQRGLSGWVAYSYGLSSRWRDDMRWAPGHDRRHDVDVVATWRLGKYRVGGRFGFATGTPYTPIVGEIARRSYDPSRDGLGDGHLDDPDRVVRWRPQRRPVSVNAPPRPGCLSRIPDGERDRRALRECRQRLQCRERLRVSLRILDRQPDAPRDLAVSHPSERGGACCVLSDGGRCALMLLLAGCEIEEIAIPRTEARVALHGVLSASASTQVILLERTRNGSVTPVAPSFDLGDPIGSDAGIAEAGATVSLTTPGGETLVAHGDRPGVYRFAPPGDRARAPRYLPAVGAHHEGRGSHRGDVRPGW